jgi:predicted Zn finger-like uncharacterized protein
MASTFQGKREIRLADADQRYNFTCPNCSGSFSIQIDRIPPVQARFRCPHCKQPMDFPSRDEARQHIRLQSEGGANAVAGNIRLQSERGASAVAGNIRLQPERGASAVAGNIRLQPERGASAVAGKAPASGGPKPPPPAAVAVPEGSASATEGTRFRVDKPGFQSDVFDRRGIRNLIRTREIRETDRVRVNDSEAVPAADLPYLKSLFSLAMAQKTQPATCCRTHTDKVAFFRCHDSGRPLCEECTSEKKFGGSTLRVCLHCGGTAEDLLSA